MMSMLKFSVIRFLMVMAGLFSATVANAAVSGNEGLSGNIRYVKEGGRGQGTSWEDASGDLQKMINYSNVGDVVYVAEGTYYAVDGDYVSDENGRGDRLRQRAIVMKDGVKVYGGFAGRSKNETPLNREKAATTYGWQLARASVITGEMKNGISDYWEKDEMRQEWRPGGYIDNAVHVVWFASNGFEMSAVANEQIAKSLRNETVLDGFVIKGGAADGTGSAGMGAGVYLAANGAVRNSVVCENYALLGGGGMYMNNGGEISDCFIFSNAASGDRIQMIGRGGGVYVNGKGLVERSFIVNNSAWIGGGLYFAKNSRSAAYEAVAEMTVVANNTAGVEAGGVYCAEAGVLTGVMVLRNHCHSVSVLASGKTGGLFCDGYGVITSSVLYGNNAVLNNSQLSGQKSGGTPESMQLFYSAIQNAATEGLENVTVNSLVDLNDAGLAGFIRDSEAAGILGSVKSPADYLSVANWDKNGCSALVYGGATVLESPFTDVRKKLKVNVPVTDITGKNISGRPDMGAYGKRRSTLQYAVLSGQLTNWKQIKVVCVDSRSEVCGDGSSWERPARYLDMAVEYLAANGGGWVWVKEGEYAPVTSQFNENPRSLCFQMKSGVKVYGGFPRLKKSMNFEERNPVAYRTVLTGDLGGKGDFSDNAYHLVVFDETLTDTAILDGFNLKGSNSLGDSYHSTENVGGAVRVKSGYAIVRNCMIENCTGATGSAIWSDRPFMVENSVINNNRTEVGGAIEVDGRTILKNLTVFLNDGIGIKDGNVSNSWIWGNSGKQIAGNIVLDYSAVQDEAGELVGKGTITWNVPLEEGLTYMSNPTKQVGVINSGYATVNGGPAVFVPNCLSTVINRGLRYGAPLYDITGAARRDGEFVDIGAYQGTCLSPENGIVRYVRVGGRGDGMSWDNASGDIQKMVNELSEIAKNNWYNNKRELVYQVWVAAGTYYGGFNLKQGVDVFGGFPATGTPGMEQRRPADTTGVYRVILDGQMNKGTRVLTQTPFYDIKREATWDGFTIQNGSVEIDASYYYGAEGSSGGGGVRLVDYGCISNCIVSNNRNEYVKDSHINNWYEKLIVRGGGVFCDGGRIINCHISNNTVGGRVLSGGKFPDCSIYGAGLYIKVGRIYNCVVANNYIYSEAKGGEETGNATALGAGVYVEGGDFYNNTIVYNRAECKGGVRGSNESVSGVCVVQSATVKNSIVWGNYGTKEQIITESNALTIVTYSCIEGGYRGTANIQEDPKFKDSDDFHLTAVSPAINAGRNFPELPSMDLDCTPRIKDGAVDMGAYEYGNFAEPTIRVNEDKRDTAVVYITLNGAGVADGSSWENAANAQKLQRAVDVLAGKEWESKKARQVWVGVGKDLPEQSVADFYPVRQTDEKDVRSKSLLIRSGVEVIGNFYGKERYSEERKLSVNPRATTVLNGDFNGTESEKEDDAYHVAIVEAGGVLNSFVVRNGNASHAEQGIFQNGGGVVVRAGGLVRSCYIQDCGALKDGAGIYLEGQDAMLAGSVVTGNVAGGMGGGVYAAAGAVLTANTIVKNQSLQGGGVSFEWPALIQGCVLWGNTANKNKNLHGEADKELAINMNGPVIAGLNYPVNYSAIEGQTVAGYANLNLLSANDGDGYTPGFRSPAIATFANGGWSLKVTSVLIDRGISRMVAEMSEKALLNYFFLDGRDMIGCSRIGNLHDATERSHMDIGAYENGASVSLRSPGDVLYVSCPGRGRRDGSSWENATGDIQAAMDYFGLRKKYGQVYVQGGVYTPFRQLTENGDIHSLAFVLNPYVRVFGGFKGVTAENSQADRKLADKNGNGIAEDYEFLYETVLDGTINPAVGNPKGVYHVLYYALGSGAETTIDGATVANGQAAGSSQVHQNGAGIWSGTPVNVKNCIFRDNRAANNGGALYLTGGALMNSYIVGNLAGQHAGGVYMQGGVAVNCNVVNNVADKGGASGVYSAGNAFLLNMTIACNRSAKDGCGIYAESGKVVNTVVWGNEGSRQIQGNADVRFCAVQGETHQAEGNIVLNADNNAADGPRFMRPVQLTSGAVYDLGADWSLQTLSVLVDAGNKDFYDQRLYPAYVNEGVDVNGQLEKIDRVQGGGIDIGAYERLYVPLKRGIARMYVRTWEEPTVKSDGSSWRKATSDLQGAIETMEKYGVGEKEIWVAQGEYVPVKRESDGAPSFVIERGGVKIYGGFPDDKKNCNPGMSERNYREYVSVLNGNSARSRHVVYVNDEAGLETWMDGLTIRGGNADGINLAGTGAGLYVGEKSYGLILNACIITGNKAMPGGSAIYAERFNLYNSLVFNNESEGVIVKYTSFYNNTVVRNAAGGLRINTSNKWSEISNSVFWGNTGYQLDAGKVKYTYCAVETGKNPDNGHNNILLASGNREEKGPYFRDPEDVTGKGFDLDCDSPLANIGDLSVKQGNSDLMGRQRVVFGKIDIGAMESERGFAPKGPQINFPDTATCQYSPVTINVSDGIVNGTVYWLHNDVAVGENALVVDADVPGDQLYLAVHWDGAGCYSKADSVLVRVYEAETPVLSSAPDVCEGENALLTITPRELGANYFLKDGGMTVASELYSEKEGVLTVQQPFLGEHTYQAYMTRNYGNGHLCTSRESEICLVTVHSATDGGDGVLIPEGTAAKDQSLCEGGEMATVVYRYTGTSTSAEVSEILPVEVKGVVWKVDAASRRVLIGGKPDRTFSYTIRVTGESACQSARQKGVITVNPLPRFELGN